MNHNKLKLKSLAAGSKTFLSGGILLIILAALGFSSPAGQQAAKETGISAKKYSTVAVDEKNIKWFVTENGVVSFDGTKWKLHGSNDNLPSDVNHLALAFSASGPELLVASSNGATVASLPPDPQKGTRVFKASDSPSMGDKVSRVAAGSNLLKWFATDKGIAAYGDGKWMKPEYTSYYPVELFEEFPITSLGTNAAGDTLYVGTYGAGVARIFKNNDLDAISGASEYAIWGPIIMPSDTIQSIYIARDGSKWFGTNLGIAQHTGSNTLDNWTVYTTEEGLVNDDVQAITADLKGNYWFGTKGGISVFNGSSWTTYTRSNGLNSDNILCLGVDKDGVVWIGTDNGVNSFRDGQFTSYR
ncbi:MAG TPA: two-component regulator propeller domain-containing protein [Bacteroidales bacterium]|nr:hypothetical protein [Bacteroidales bacterium]HNR40863.1 two-component regulator propeller domain-containing protein [Bacteroidales bacterium]HPM17701.1 two-component regulator propeller domain-containing protein [Bacteroidales bacterium]HQG78178.1 two-component regulator propeller domain-containing protein [Bacteroidales bacterium]